MQKIKGVNLGGWLVLERWMTPNLHQQMSETADSTQILADHYQNFITAKDFQWLAEHGVNAVRIPVGHWIFSQMYPYSLTLERLDWAFQTASKYNISVLIDLHAAPGCQNGWEHGGLEGVMEWHKEPHYIEQSLAVIEKLTVRYAQDANFLGIELLNEPHWDVPLKVIEDYYRQGYQRVRKHHPTVAVVIHDSFRPEKWDQFNADGQMSDIYLDCHLYQCFSSEDKKLDMPGHLKKTEQQWGQLINKLQKTIPVIIGEWSLGLDPQSLDGLNEEQQQNAAFDYAQAQIKTFESAAGWFFWNYKTEDQGGWNYRWAVESGLIPTFNKANS